MSRWYSPTYLAPPRGSLFSADLLLTHQIPQCGINEVHVMCFTTVAVITPAVRVCFIYRKVLGSIPRGATYLMAPPEAASSILDAMNLLQIIHLHQSKWNDIFDYIWFYWRKRGGCFLFLFFMEDKWEYFISKSKRHTLKILHWLL